MNCQIEKGDRVRYKSFAGDVYDAVFVGVDPKGFAAIDVLIPGVAEPWPLKAVRLERIVIDDAEGK